MILALFDFDGTVTTKDSMLEFMLYAVGKPSFYFRLLQISPILILYKLHLISNHSAKESLISAVFKGWRYALFEEVADTYSNDLLNEIIRPSAIEKIRWHQQQGHKVVIVSASIENWLREWCKKNNIDLIATRLMVKGGKLTGRFEGRNCHGQEKVNRITARYELSEYSDIYAYGDSPGDKAMLGIASKPYYRYFD
ncbi:MAG TPA: haloacid dehalogenase-like hydrolase [Gammaproteobacteria bacterium]|nr:haloacid dehalogenase-like hydrolase [Gammaproteobacteria bacterium]